MFSKSVDSTIKAYKYTFHSFESGTGESLRGHKDITEIFIPSHQVCFNEDGAFKSDKARAEEGSLTEVYLSTTLVDKIVQSAILKAQFEEAQFMLIINQEYQEVIGDSSPLNKKRF